MKTLIRTLAWLAGVVVLLLVAVAVAVTFYFDPNDYKADIESVIESSTGRKVRIPGDLSLGLLPCCAVEVGRVELDNPPGFAEKQFVAIDSASVSIGLFPLLLRQEIVIGEVVLEGFDATLITRRDGSVNWEFDSEPAAAAPVVDTSADTESSAVTLNQLSVKGLRFTGGRVRWLDETTGDDILVNQLSVVTGPIELGEPFDLEAGFTVAGLAEGLDGEFLYTGRPVVDQENLTADLSDSVIELILTGNDLPGGKATIAITAPELTVGGSVNAVVANQLKLDISTGPLVLRAVASGVVADSRPSFSGTLEADSFAPRELLDLLDIEIVTADPYVLSLMDLRADWVFRGDRVGLSNLVMRIDDSQLSGELGLGSIEKEQILFDLAIDAINLDRYLEPVAAESAGGGAAPAGSTTAAPEEELFPVDTLRELNAQGRFRIGEMVVSGLVMSDFTMNLKADGGLLRLNPLTATMYQGSYSGDIRLDVRGTQPKLSLNENLSNLQIGGLLVDTQDLQNVEGLFTTSITATSTGNTEAALIAGLNGNLAFNLADGLYRGRDFWYEVRRQKALIKGEPVPAAPADPTTDITRLQGSGVLTNGVLQNNDFAMQLPFVRLNGTGQADLNSMLLNYKLSAKVVGRPQFDDGTNLAELEGLTLPVTIKGPVDEPDIVIDLTSLITGLATKKLQDTLLKKYGGEEPAADGDGTADQEPISDRDATKQLLRKGVRDLLN
jgi:AsmA protein